MKSNIASQRFSLKFVFHKQLLRVAAKGIVSIVFQHYNEWNDLEETLERLFLNFSGKNK